MADFPDAVNPFSGASDPQHSPVEPPPSKFAVAVNPFQSPVVEPEQQVAEAEPIKYAAARKALMKKRSEAKSKEQKAKIDKQLLMLDRKNADIRSDAALRAVDYPQRKLKEAISGDENIWHNYNPETMSPSHYAAINTGLDLVADPIDLVTLGLAKSANLARKAAGTAGKGKDAGLLLQGASNYVNDYYGLAKGYIPSKLDEKVGLLTQKLCNKFADKTPIPDESRVAAGRKGLGMLDTLAEGGTRGVLDSLNPFARAQYKQTGVAPSTQSIVGDHLADYKQNLEEAAKVKLPSGRGAGEMTTGAGDLSYIPAKRPLQKAVAQAQYANNIGRQADRVGEVAPELRRVTDEISNLATAVPNEEGAIVKLFQDNPGQITVRTQRAKSPTGKPRTTQDGKKIMEDITEDYLPTETDMKFVEKQMNEAMGTPDVITMKRPEQMATGKHHYDVLGSKNHGQRAIDRVWRDLNVTNKTEVTTDVLYKSLTEESSRLRKANEKAFSVVKAEDGSGVWVFNGTNASAITEGGIGALIKISPDGRMMGFMMDKHDWLEKIMSKASKVLPFEIEKKLLPTSLGAVTPPMYKDVWDLPMTSRAVEKTGTKVPKKVRPKKVTNKGSNEYATAGNNTGVIQEALEGLLRVKPTDTAVAGELLSDASKASFLFGSAGNRIRNNDEQ